MGRAAVHGERPRGGEDVVERCGRDHLGIVGGLGGRAEEAADLAGLPAGVGGVGCSRSPGGSPGARGCGAVVVAVPARVPVEPLDPILGGRRPGQARSEIADGDHSMPAHGRLPGVETGQGSGGPLGKTACPAGCKASRVPGELGRSVFSQPRHARDETRLALRSGRVRMPSAARP